MPDEYNKPRYELTYWPIPFRGCFVSYLFAYRGVPLQEQTSFDAIIKAQRLPPEEQAIPFIGPPVLKDLRTGQVLSQMPAIVTWVASGLELMPTEPFDQALALKVLMDCNDVLMEICRYNGSMMWEREAWVEFRSQRLPRWLRSFEVMLQRRHIGADPVSFSDIAVYALFGNMIRCLPELAGDLTENAPGIAAHCQQIGAQPSLAEYVARQDKAYGDQYCGGQIEQSIRRMLALDAES
ncbi:MAG: glutathione S-transferase family protein [Pseudomonadota bacterium]